MKGTIFWQNPYVDVFKHFKILDLQNIDYQGKISIVHEQDIGRKVLKIDGKISASNYIAFPGKQSEFKTLGLIGNYIYIQLQSPAGSIFMFHLTFSLNNKIIKLSFSNVYKSVKRISQHSLQVPISEHPLQWTTFMIDSQSYLMQMVQVKQGFDSQLRSIQVCANAKYQNIYTSNDYFTDTTMPRDVCFVIGKNERYLDKYQYAILSWNRDNFPLPEDPKSDENQNNENKRPQTVSPKKDLNKEIQYGQKYLQSILKNNSAGQHQEECKGLLQYDQDQPHQTAPSPYLQKEIKPASTQFNINPTPIMRLCHIQGYTGGLRNILNYGKNRIVYSSGNIMILYDLATRQQKYFFGQNTTIQVITGISKQNLIITCDDQQLSYWNAATMQRTGFYFTGLTTIIDLDVGLDSKTRTVHVVIVGIDENQRLTILLVKNDQIILQHISEFDVSRIQFLDQTDVDLGMLSLGREIIRFWKVKKTTINRNIAPGNASTENAITSVLTGSCVYLGEHARDSIFYDMVFYNTQDDLNKKAIIVSSLGNLFIVDIPQKEVVGVFMIHDQAIQSIGLHPDNHFVVTCGNSGKVKIWQIDFTESLFQFQLDSQVNSVTVLEEGNIICGCLNGTLGIMSTTEKKFVYLQRSHNQEIIQIDYQQASRKLITVSKDHTIRIWDIMVANNTKSGQTTSSVIINESDSVFFQQVYEFRCLDEQVTALASMHVRHLFMTGFESGIVRIFDIKSNSILCELNDHHQAAIKSISTSFLDKMILTIDQLGYVNLFNDHFQIIKSFDPKAGSNNKNISGSSYTNTSAGFNVTGQIFFVHNQMFSIKIFCVKTLSQRSVIEFEEPIVQCAFTHEATDLFTVSEKSRVKKYQMHPLSFDFQFIRQYATLHTGQVYSLTPSSNCSYFFTTGQDNLVKVWDYHFRGGLMPAFQAYNCGQPVNQVVPSNDDFSIVFSFGVQSKSLFCWKFLGNMTKVDKDYIEQAEKEDKQAQEIMGLEKDEVKNIFTNLSQLKDADNNYLEEIVKTQMPVRPVDLKSIYDAYDQFNLPEHHQFQPAPINDKQNQKETNNVSAPVEQRKDDEQYFQLMAAFGFNNRQTIPQSDFIWNKEQNYIVNLLNNLVIVNFIQEKREQKVFPHTEKLAGLKMSPTMKYFVYSDIQGSFFRFIDCKTLQTIQTIKNEGLGTLENLIALQVSQCSNYIVSLVATQEEIHTPMLSVWEVASSREVCTSMLTMMKPLHGDQSDLNFTQLSWNTTMSSQLDFTIIFRETVFFWRVNSRMALQYQEASIDSKQLRFRYGLFTSACYCFENLLFVGTALGAILVLDVRSGALLCICSSVINQAPIYKIFVSFQRVTIFSNNTNIYSWNTNTDHLKELAEKLQDAPGVTTLDSFPVSVSYSGETQEPVENILVISQSGELWMVDFEDNATLKLCASHQSDKQINYLRYYSKLHDYYRGQIFSASNDSTLQLFELDQLQMRGQYFVPRRECTSFDLFFKYTICIAGFNDGAIRFWDFETSVSLGTVYLHGDQQGNNAIGPSQYGPGPYSISPLMAISSVVVLPGSQNALVGNQNGDIYMVYIRDMDRMKFKVDVHRIVDNLGFAINQVAVSQIDPLNIWLVCTKNGQINTWNRKNLNRSGDDENELQKIYQLNYYLTDSYRFEKSRAPLRFDDQSGPENCYAAFCPKNNDQFFAISQNHQSIIIRNFREHSNLKTIPISHYPLLMSVNAKSTIIITGDDKGNIYALDSHNGIELDQFQCSQSHISSLYLYDVQKKSNMDHVPKGADVNKFAPMLFIASQNQIMVFNFDV